ncbi:MAG: hypothetical protein MJ147_06025 [Clostridia bacterium]|nr:hypothetical protein [Clostridia bacterium]
MESGTFYNENKANQLRRIKLAVVVFVTFLLQNNSSLFIRPTDVPVMLLVPLIVCIGMFEREKWGMFFGLFAGILVDAFSAESLCFHSIALTCIGFLSGLLITGIFRNNLKTCLLFSSVSIFVYNTVYFLLYYVSAAGIEADYIYINIYFASVIYTFLFVGVFYVIVRAICSKKKD